MAAPGASSLWNSAGTWEERDVSAWAKERLKGLFTGLELEDGGVKVSIKSVNKITGEGRVLFIRGKKRAGFEFHLTLLWEVFLTDGEKATGSITLDELSETSIEDIDMNVTVKTGPPSVKKSVEKLSQKLQELLASFHEEMKDL